MTMPENTATENTATENTATENTATEVASMEITATGARLDEHHAPETNGRMAVCRRCGIQTDTPQGTRHQPGIKQLDRAHAWLDGQARLEYITAVRQSGNR